MYDLTKSLNGIIFTAIAIAITVGLVVGGLIGFVIK